MQLSSVLTFIAALAVASAAAVPEAQTTVVNQGECGFNNYDGQYYCFIRGVAYGCERGSCKDRSGSQFPCSGGDGHYTCPA